MTIKTCRECSKEISTEAKKCPNCGCADPTATTIKIAGVPVTVDAKGIGCLGVVILLLIFWMGQGLSRAFSDSPAASSPPVTTQAYTPPPQADVIEASPKAAAPISDSIDDLDGLTTKLDFAKPQDVGDGIMTLKAYCARNGKLFCVRACDAMFTSFIKLTDALLGNDRSLVATANLPAYRPQFEGLYSKCLWYAKQPE